MSHVSATHTNEKLKNKSKLTFLIGVDAPNMPLEMLAADETFATVFDGALVCSPALDANRTAAASDFLDLAAVRGIMRPGRRDVVVHSTVKFAIVIVDGGNLAAAGFLRQVRDGHGNWGARSFGAIVVARRDGAEGSWPAESSDFFGSVECTVGVVADALLRLGILSIWARARAIF